MPFLEMIDLHHEWQPHLPRGCRASSFLHEPSKLLGLEALDPRIDCRPRDVQETTDTDLLPPLIVEFDDL
jgi:hypothetical protein